MTPPRQNQWVSSASWDAPTIAQGIPTAIAWWIVPKAPSAETLHTVIKKTAKHYNSPTFHPHVTLFVLRDTDKTAETLVKLTRPVVAAAKSPISLAQAGVQVGETYHQSVYLALSPADELTTLREDLLKALGAPAGTESSAFPHASLYYGEGSKDAKSDVVTQMMEAGTVDINKKGVIEITGLESRFDFTEIWIVNIANEHPDSWKVLHKEPLASEELAASLPPSPVVQAPPSRQPFTNTSDSPTSTIPHSAAQKSRSSTNNSTAAPDGNTPSGKGTDILIGN